ncbi:hypothetical protein niasHT_009058 [Heterodera trifolii]|uniref:C3H1-type domain-containing protein n=1 Tax=Heterodera trifolii TaxID=157864 RepID=A0ABD2MCU3_9BILA
MAISSFLGLYFAIIWLCFFNEHANGSGGEDKPKTIGDSFSKYVSVDQFKKMQNNFKQLEEEVKELKKQMLLQQQVNVLTQNQNNILAALCNGIDYHQQQHNWTDEGSQSPSPVGPFANGSTDFSLFTNMSQPWHSQSESPKPTDSYAEVAAKPPTVANIRQINVPMPLASVEPKKKSPTNGNEEENAAGKDSPYNHGTPLLTSSTYVYIGVTLKVEKKDLKAAIPPNYKTEVCKRWSSGTCMNGEGCHFAHGQKELRQLGVTKKSSSNVPSPSKSHQSRRKS